MCFARNFLWAGAVGAAAVVLVQLDPATGKVTFQIPKPLSVTERPPSVMVGGEHAGGT